MAEKNLPIQLSKRTPLQDMIPLDTPFSVLLSPIDHCNIKCVFCPFHGAVRGDVRPPATMPFDLFRIVIDQLTEFPHKLRALIFCGRGEPTLHRELPQMISYAKEKDVADAIRLTTNGFNLSPELNRRLIDAGLDYIRISVPAIEEQACYEITGARLDLNQYIKNIKDFYDHKREGMTVFCKTTNVALGARDGGTVNPELVEKFYTAFDNCCDYAFIENIVPQVPRELSGEEKKQMWIGNTGKQNVYQAENAGSAVCERLFYHFTVNSMGNVYPCDLNENENLLLGNVRADTLKKIWQSCRLLQLRLSSLKGAVPGACKGCGVFYYDFPNELHKYAGSISDRLINSHERRNSYGSQRTSPAGQA